MKEVKAIIQPFMIDAVLDALMDLPGLPGVAVSEVDGLGREHHANESGGDRYAFVRMAKVEILVPDPLLDRVVSVIRDAAHTGQPGDGKILVVDVLRAVRIRTGEEDDAAL